MPEGRPRDAVVACHDGGQTQLAVLDTGRLISVAAERAEGSARMLLNPAGAVVAVVLSTGEVVDLPAGQEVVHGCALRRAWSALLRPKLLTLMPSCCVRCEHVQCVLAVHACGAYLGEGAPAGATCRGSPAAVAS